MGEPGPLNPRASHDWGNRIAKLNVETEPWGVVRIDLVKVCTNQALSRNSLLLIGTIAPSDGPTGRLPPSTWTSDNSPPWWPSPTTVPSPPPRKPCSRCSRTSRRTSPGWSAELGVTLVDRGQGTLTDAGQVVVSRGRRIQAELDALRADVASLGAEVAGDVRLGVIPTTARWLLPRVVATLQARHPKVRLVVTSATTTSLLPGVRGDRRHGPRPAGRRSRGGRHPALRRGPRAGGAGRPSARRPPRGHVGRGRRAPPAAAGARHDAAQRHRRRRGPLRCAALRHGGDRRRAPHRVARARRPRRRHRAVHHGPEQPRPRQGDHDPRPPEATGRSGPARRCPASTPSHVVLDILQEVLRSGPAIPGVHLHGTDAPVAS